MIVPERRQWGSVEVDVARTAFADGSDAGQRNGARGQAASRADREQQFVIFAAVEALVERRAGKQRRRHDLGRDTGGDTEALKIERQAVAEIHGSSGVNAGAEKAAEGDAGLGADVTFPGGAASGGESHSGSAQLAGYIDGIARARAVAPESGPTRDG